MTTCELNNGRLGLSQSMRYSTEVWGEEQAKAAVESMSGNRPLNHSRVRSYMRAMLDGRWLLSPHPMVFDRTGRFIDGQHRAYAIMGVSKIIPNFTLTVQVARNCDADVARVIDNGLPKGAAAIGSMIHNAMGRAEVACATGMMYKPSRNKKIRNKWLPDEIANWYDEHREAIDFSIRHISHNTFPVVSGIARIAMARAWYSEDRERLAEFGAVARTMVCEDEGDSAAHVLKQQSLGMQARRMSANSYGMANSYSVCSAAIRAFCLRQSVRLLRPSKSAYYATPYHPAEDAGE